MDHFIESNHQKLIFYVCFLNIYKNLSVRFWLYGVYEHEALSHGEIEAITNAVAFPAKVKVLLSFLQKNPQHNLQILLQSLRDTDQKDLYDLIVGDIGMRGDQTYLKMQASCEEADSSDLYTHLNTHLYEKLQGVKGNYVQRVLR